LKEFAQQQVESSAGFIFSEALPQHFFGGGEGGFIASASSGSYQA